MCTEATGTTSRPDSCNLLYCCLLSFFLSLSAGRMLSPRVTSEAVCWIQSVCQLESLIKYVEQRATVLDQVSSKQRLRQGWKCMWFTEGRISGKRKCKKQERTGKGTNRVCGFTRVLICSKIPQEPWSLNSTRAGPAWKQMGRAALVPVSGSNWLKATTATPRGGRCHLLGEADPSLLPPPFCRNQFSGKRGSCAPPQQEPGCCVGLQ